MEAQLCTKMVMEPTLEVACEVEAKGHAAGCTMDGSMQGMAEQACLEDNRVVWTCGDSLRKQFKLHGQQVLQVLWADFQQGAVRDVLCLLQRQQLVSCAPGGALQASDLGGPVEAAWACTEGLLLAAPQEVGVSLLTHPLGHALPVVADVALRAGGPGPSYAGWSGEVVVWAGRQLPLVATFSRGAGRLAFWRLEQQRVSRAAIGNLPDLAAATPLQAYLSHTPGGPLLHPTGGPARRRTADTPYSPAPSLRQRAASGSVMKARDTPPPSARKPAARTPQGALSPALFQATPRGPRPSLASLRPPSGRHPSSQRRHPSTLSPATPQGGPPAAMAALATPGAWAGGLPAHLLPSPFGVVDRLHGGSEASGGVLWGGGSVGGRTLVSAGASWALGSLSTGTQAVAVLVAEHVLTPGEVPEGACLVTCSQGRPLLAVMCPGAAVLRVFDLTRGGRDVTPLFSLPALAATAVRATCSPHPHSPLGGQLQELLLLSPQGQLCLHQGRALLCRIRPLPPAPGLTAWTPHANELASAPCEGSPRPLMHSSGSSSPAWQALLQGPHHLAASASGHIPWLAPPWAGGPPSLHPSYPAPPLTAPRASAEGQGREGEPGRASADRHQALLALHALYEGLKLDVLRWPLQLRLGLLLAGCASRLGNGCGAAHWEMYARDLGPGLLRAHAIPPAPLPPGPPGPPGPLQGRGRPADILRTLSDMLEGRPPAAPVPPPSGSPGSLSAPLGALPPPGAQQPAAPTWLPRLPAPRPPLPPTLLPHPHPWARGGCGEQQGVEGRWQHKGGGAAEVPGSTPPRPPTPPPPPPPCGKPRLPEGAWGSRQGQRGGSRSPRARTGKGAQLLAQGLRGSRDGQGGRAVGGQGGWSLPRCRGQQGTALTRGPRGGGGLAAWCRGMRLTHCWYSWRPPSTQRIHLPAHHLDCGARRTHLLAAAGGQGGQGLADAAKASLKFQEMWDGLEGLRRGATRLRFSRDARLAEVSRLLASSAPVTLNIDLPDGDPELPAKQQQQLMSAALRTMALAVGRGALTLGTAHPLPTEPLVIPPLCLSGTDPGQHHANINLDLSTAQPAPGGGAAADITAWAEFHNGAAAGLRMVAESSHATGPVECDPDGYDRCDAGTRKGDGGAVSASPLTRNWIVFHRPDSPSYTHAGLLMALGLTGHLSKLAWTDLYRYLSDQHDATTLGVLLGMAASKRGSQDALVSKMLLLHLPSTHPDTFPEAGALLGLGLLYQGSCHRLMVEPGASGGGARGRGGPAGAAAAGLGGVSQEREGYALAAGLALGLMTLGVGRGALGLMDMGLEQQLKQLMLGDTAAAAALPPWGSGCGSASAATAPPPGAQVAGGGWEPLGGPGPGGLGQAAAALQLAGLVARDQEGEGGGSGAGQAASAPQLVLEGAAPPLTVSSPAACLALALMFLRTNDAEVAALFALPATRYALAQLPPQLSVLRALGRALGPLARLVHAASPSSAPQPPCHSAPGPGFGPLGALGGGRSSRQRLGPPDCLARALNHLGVLAGACLALGLKFAGSASADAHRLLCAVLEELLAAKQQVPDAQPPPASGPLASSIIPAPPPLDDSSAAAALARVHCLDKGPLEDCLDVVLLALALVMAGTGHLPTFRLMASLSERRHPVHGYVVSGLGLGYGNHMALNMALGFLFLGAGNVTFGTSNTAVAALLVSLFPHLPSSTTDHQRHLQALRHMYVLATEPRCIEAMDVDSKQLVYVPLEVALRDMTSSQQGRDGARRAEADEGPGMHVRQEARTAAPEEDMDTDCQPPQASRPPLSKAPDPLPAPELCLSHTTPCLLPDYQQVKQWCGRPGRLRGPRGRPGLPCSQSSRHKRSPSQGQGRVGRGSADPSIMGFAQVLQHISRLHHARLQPRGVGSGAAAAWALPVMAQAA
ncbi:hypothetical protein V8C86DRAFT_3027443 [Haematococcus lacustris]